MRNLLPEDFCAERYGDPDSRTGANLLGESHDPAPRGKQTGTSGNAPTVFQTLLRPLPYGTDFC